jgi:hypothetical protein
MNGSRYVTATALRVTSLPRADPAPPPFAAAAATRTLLLATAAAGKKSEAKRIGSDRSVSQSVARRFVVSPGSRGGVCAYLGRRISAWRMRRRRRRAAWRTQQPPLVPALVVEGLSGGGGGGGKKRSGSVPIGPPPRAVGSLSPHIWICRATRSEGV